MDTVTLILLGIMPALAIVAGLKDLTSMKIPNWISGLLVLAFFPAAFAVGIDPVTVAMNIGIAALALVVGAGLAAAMPS
jgi:prepilin peptidase CpaA